MARAITFLVIAALVCACHAHEESKVASDKAHTELTSAILAAIPDDRVEQAVMDYVDAKIGADQAHAPQIVANLQVGARALYITRRVEAGVANGGFERYYSNDTSHFADDAPEAFEFFSAHEHAALMREANSVRALDASRLGSLDAKFRAIQEDMSALRIAKIRAMPGFFTGK